MGRIFLSLIVAGFVAVGLLVVLRYFELPYDGSWVFGVFGVIALLVWTVTGGKKKKKA